MEKKRSIGTGATGMSKEQAESLVDFVNKLPSKNTEKLFDENGNLINGGIVDKGHVTEDYVMGVDYAMDNSDKSGIVDISGRMVKDNKSN